MPGELPMGWLSRKVRQPETSIPPNRRGRAADGSACLAEASARKRAVAGAGPARGCYALRQPAEALKAVAGSRIAALAGSVLAGLLAAGPASAQMSSGISVFDSTSVMLLAVFGGAMSFALLSAFWLIRERGRIVNEFGTLRTRFGEVRADRDRLASLVELDDQRIIVWDGSDGVAGSLGSLPERCGAPDKVAEFIAFGRWLEPASAQRMEANLDGLRRSAQQFTTPLTTRNGAELEAQGRVSGGNAFVRFVPIEGAREKIARLEADHQVLTSRFGLLETLFGATDAPIWIADRDGKLAYVNEALARAVEAANPDAAVQANRQLFDASERALIEQGCEKSGIHRGELPAVVAGDRKMLEAVVVRTAHGFAGMAIDRSEIDAVRSTLKHAIASHQQTFDHLAAGVAIFDKEQRLQFHNASFQQLWELDARDLEGRPSSGDLIDLLRGTGKLPDSPEWRKWKEGVLATLKGTESHQDHWHLPDGRTLRVIVNPHKQGGASWVFENLTEEMELKSSYNALMRVQGETLDHLGEAVAVFGSNGRIRLTNPAFAGLWGFSDQAALTGRHVREISEQVTSRIEEAEAWQVIQLGITGMDEERNDLSGRLDLSDGSVRDYRLVRLPEGQTMLTLADVTASVNVERALKERNDALEESDALKTRFIQHVSYELRAPLTSIAGFAEILASNSPGKLNEKQEEYLDYITQSSDVLKALIDDILDLASIDAGAMELDLEPVELGEVIEQSLEGVGSKTGRSGIAIEVDLASDATALIADRGRLRQIIYNLVANAVSASPDGGTVRVESRRGDGEVAIRVSDEGPGIPEEERDLIFRRFESRRGTGRKGGAGLGLSIVRSFVELHGGKVVIENGAERGACFTCLFPIEPQAAREAAE